MEIQKGSIVISLAGREKGRLFLVTEEVDDLFVLLADGHLRRLEKPKTKKRKHIKVLAIAPDQPLEKIEGGGPLTNARLRKIINALSEDMKKTTPKEG